MRLKQLLSEKGMTAKSLAASTGLTEMGLSKIITGKSSPNAETIVKIASALGVSCGALFDDYEDCSVANHSAMSCPYCGHELKVNVE